MTMLHKQAVTFTTENTVSGPVEYKLTPSTREDESDTPPVVFCVRSGVASFQDYFTPEQADEMAAAWTEVARRARVANGLALDDATVDRLARELVDGAPGFSVPVTVADVRRVRARAAEIRADAPVAR